MNVQDLLTRLKAEGLSPSLKLRLEGDAEPSAETLELVRHHKADLLSALIGVQGIPRLPWQLERLICAAGSNQLPKDPVMLTAGLITDMNRYTLACASAYLMGDRGVALQRLWELRRVWMPEEAVN